MESGPKSLTMENTIIKDTIFNAEFIGYINTLSNAILEFYKVSKNIHMNKDLLINYGKNELNNDEILNNNTDNNILNELINTLTEIFNKLEFNNKSQENNLSNFYEDAKIVFKKLRETRQEIIVQLKKNANSRKMTDVTYSTRNSLNKKKKLLSQQKGDKTFTKSYANINVNDLKEDILGFDRKKNKSVNLNEENGMNLNEQNNKRLSPFLTNEYINNINIITEHSNNNTLGQNITSKNDENELNKLKMINKKLNSELNRYKTLQINIEELKNNNNFNTLEKINTFVRDKEKVISSLKEEMNKLNKNHQILLNKYKKQIKALQNENDRLRSNTSLSGNPKSDVDLSIISKLNTLMKENKKLKNNIEELKVNNFHSEFNAKVDQNINQFENINKENKTLINKIRILENKFQQKQNENIQLNSKIINLTNKYKNEINTITNKYNELSINFINKENELLILQKEILNKNSSIENYKNLLNKDINGKQKMDNEEYEKRIKELESNLEKNKKLEFNLNKQISNLNQQIKNKDAKLLKQNYQLEQIQSQLITKKAENQKLLNYIDNIKLTYENNNNNNLNEKLEEQQNINNDLNDELTKVKNDNEILKNKIISTEKRITILNQNSDLQKIKEQELDKIKNENKSLKFENERLDYQFNQLKENLLLNDPEQNKKKEEEIDGLKQLIEKLQKEKEKIDDELNNVKKENEKIKNQMMRLSKTLPEEYNELQKHYNELENKYISLKNKNPNATTPKKTKAEEKQIEKMTKELADSKKEIEQLKRKNMELINQLEDKEINKNYYDVRSEDGNKSNYEEEFDLRKMAKGAKDKNRSQDINIDYPGIQTYKEKVRELEFYYNSLENLVKKLLLTIQCNPKNKTYVTELCKIVGFDLETTNKIITNKNKNFILGLFSK